MKIPLYMVRRPEFSQSLVVPHECGRLKDRNDPTKGWVQIWQSSPLSGGLKKGEPIAFRFKSDGKQDAAKLDPSLVSPPFHDSFICTYYCAKTDATRLVTTSVIGQFSFGPQEGRERTSVRLNTTFTEQLKPHPSPSAIH